MQFDNDPGAAEKIEEMFGSPQIDQAIRQAIQFCWMSLPKDRRTPDELEAQVRRLVERAIRDFREDRKAFGREP